MFDHILRTVVSSIGDGVVAADRQGNVSLFNPAAERILGMGAVDAPPEEWPQKYGVYLPDTSTPFPFERQPLLRALRGEKCDRVEAFIRNDNVPDGVWIEVTGRPVEDDRGTIHGGIVVFRDVSDVRRARQLLESAPRKLPASELASSHRALAEALVEFMVEHARLEADLQQRNQAHAALARAESQLRQAQKMEAVGRVAGGVAHDFNNILSVMLSHASMLIEDLDPTSESMTDALQIHAAAERGRRLTNQLLAFSRRQLMRPAPLDVSELLRSLEPMISRLVGDDVTVTLRLCDTLGSALLDRGQIEQVLINLIVNAQEAMPRGGKLTIESSNVELDERYSDAHYEVKRGSYVMVAVTDTGSGIDPETQQRIFEPFFTTKERATGLGLASVYGIVRQSGGHVWVYSEVGRGTTFKLYFPRHGAAAVPVTDSLGPAPRGSGEIVLVVEDEALVRRAVCAILRRAGYDVRECGSGREALEIVKSVPGIAVIVLDVILDGETGPELLVRLREHCQTARVLFTSGYNEEHVLDQGVPVHGAAFVQKPVTPDALLAAVHRLARGRG